MPAAVGDDLVALVNGSQLYILNRYNGEMLYQAKIGGSPNAGPALSDKAVYIPITTGAVLAYRLEFLADPAQLDLMANPKSESASGAKDMSAEQQKAAETARRDNLRLNQEYQRPAVCMSNGLACVPPILIRQDREEEVVAWPTDRGAVTVARIDRRDMSIMTIKYEMKTDGAILAKLAYLPPDPKVNGDVGLIFAASTNGYLYAVTENGHKSPWKFPASEPLIQPPAAIDNHVYFVTQLGGMFCCDAKTGKQLWSAPEVLQFVAASKQRVYASDHSGRTQVLDAKTGAQAGCLAHRIVAHQAVELRRPIASTWPPTPAWSNASMKSSKSSRSSTARTANPRRRRSRKNACPTAATRKGGGARPSTATRKGRKSRQDDAQNDAQNHA